MQRLIDLEQLVSCGQNGDLGPPVNLHCLVPEGGQHTDLLGPNHSSRSHHQLAPVDVLSRGPNVIASPHRCTHVDLASRDYQTLILGSIEIAGVLVGDHCIGALRQGGAGHYPDGCTRLHTRFGDVTRCHATDYGQRDR